MLKGGLLLICELDMNIQLTLILNLMKTCDVIKQFLESCEVAFSHHFYNLMRLNVCNKF